VAALMNATDDQLTQLGLRIGGRAKVRRALDVRRGVGGAM